MNLKDFVMKYSDLIDAQDFPDIYKKTKVLLSRDDKIQLTNCFLDLNLNPLIGFEDTGDILSGTNIIKYTIPNNIVLIDDYAFEKCTSLTSITIPNSVKSIGWRAFSYCRSLTSVTIPDSVTCIGSFAFQNCTSLTSITLPDSLTNIDTAAFQGCSGLTSITIPGSIEYIGYYAFRGCSNLRNIYFRGTQEQWEAVTKDSGWNEDTGNYTITYLR